MKRIFASLALILMLAPMAQAKSKKQKKAPEFGFGSVKQMTAKIADINIAENFILIHKGKGAKKKVLANGALIVKVTDSGPSVAGLSDLVKDQKAHFWVKKKPGAGKAYEGLIISQFLGAKVLASLPPVVQFAVSVSQGLENAAAAISVSLSKTTDKDVRVAYTVAGTATGAGTDYTLANGELVIAAGQTTGFIPLVVADDTAQESDETVIITLASATNATLGAQKNYTYTIQDNDQSGVGFETTASNGAESVTSVNFKVILSAAAAQEVRVDYAVSGTATGSGTDFTLANGTITIPAGQTFANIAATVVDDTAIEVAETIIVTLSSPTGANLSVNTVHTYTINDNDQPTIGFGSAASSGAESVATVNIPVNLSVASIKQTQVNYAVTGTATGGGTDYALANGTLTIPAGQTTANITLAVADDTSDEVDETVIVTLSGPVDATLSATSVHTYTIQDNDNPTIHFTNATGNGAESVTPVSIGLTLSAAPAQEVQVPYTLSGTATGSGTDYTLAAGTLTVPAGQTIANLSLVIIDDALADAAETVIVTLGTPTNATLGTNTAFTYTINDND